MNEERTEKCLRQMEHIRGHLWHRLPRSWLITWCVTKLTHRVSLVKQERFTLPENLSSHPDLSGVRNTRSLVLYVCLVDHCLSFLTLFFLSIVFSVLLWYTNFEYPLVFSNSSLWGGRYTFCDICNWDEEKTQ